MRRNAIVRIVLYSLALLLLIPMLIAGISFRQLSFAPFSVFSKTHSDAALASSGSVTAAGVKKLEIEWVSGHITVQPGDGNEICFSETDGIPEAKRMVWKQTGDTLTLRYSESKASFSLIGLNMLPVKDLLVTVPRNWDCRELSIDSVSARIEVSSINAQTIELDNVSGRCSFTDCAAEEFRAETVSGEVEWNGAVQELQFGTVSADCIAAVPGTPQEIEMDSVSGDLRLSLPEISGFAASLDSTSGRPSISFPVTSAHKIYIYGDSSCDISMSSVSGNLIIDK